MRKNDKITGHLVILFVNIVFGINTPIAKGALIAVGPYVLTFFRFAGCAVFFWLASLVIKVPKATKEDRWKLCIASIFGIVLNLFLFIIGLSMTTPSNASITVSMTPIFTMIMAFIFLKEPISWKKFIGIMVGLSGAIILILTGNNIHNAIADNNAIGILIVILSGIAYALYLTLFAPLIKRNHPVTVMKWMFLASTIIILPFTLPSIMKTDFQAVEPHIWLNICYVVLMATFVNYLLIPVGQARLRPTVLSMYNYIQPVVSTTIAVITFMEILTIYKIIACILVFLGVYIVSKSKAREQN